MQLEDETKVIKLVRLIRFASLDHSCNRILNPEVLLALHITVNFHVCQGNTVTPFSTCDIQYSSYDK